MHAAMIDIRANTVVKMAEIEDGAVPLSQADRDSIKIRNSGALLLSALVLCRSASQRC